MDRVVIVEYAPRWSELFAQEAKNLRDLFGSKLLSRIEHIGSTSIVGMPAKPIIDMLIAILSFDRAKQEIVPKLVDKGYVYLWRSDRPPGHMMFIKGLPPQYPRTHHLHFAPQGHKLWERLYFRDYLRNHPDEANKYAQLKRELAAKFSTDREAYTNGKSDYVSKITVLARSASLHRSARSQTTN